MTILIRSYARGGQNQDGGETNEPPTDYVIGPSGTLQTQNDDDDASVSSLFAQRRGFREVSSLRSHVKNVLFDLFLPIGFPASVDETYLQYQAYDSLQGLCSYLRGVVSTSAVLSAAGVGDANATALSAAVLWALRDGAGMIGGLVFSYGCSRHFDSYVKEFRLFADLINDVALTFDMAAPHISSPDFRLYVGTASTLCKVMCGMAAGATKASITAHFALRGNMADLNAKESTQETLVTLMGLTLGVRMAKWMEGFEKREGDESTTTTTTTFWVAWTVFGLLTGIHVWANYRAVSLLRLRTLNRPRADVVLKEMFRPCCSDDDCREPTSSSVDPVPRLPPPEEVDESVFGSYLQFWKTTMRMNPTQLHLGTSLTMADSGSGDIAFWIRHFLETHNERYLLTVVRRKEVCVVLTMDAKDEDKLRAFVHARMIQESILGDKSIRGRDDWNDLVLRTHERIRQLFDAVDGPVISIDKLRSAGWNCECLYLGYGEVRIQYLSKEGHAKVQ